MMVDDNHIDTARLEAFNDDGGTRTAVNRKQDFRREFRERGFDRSLAQTVALILAVREIELRANTEMLKEFREERNGAYPVHVIVAENQDSLIFGFGQQQTLRRLFKVRDVKRIGKL